MGAGQLDELLHLLLGGAHALTPGHGKTLVAAYLVFGMVGFGTTLVAAPILGQLSDRFGRRPVLAFSIAGTAIGYVPLRRWIAEQHGVTRVATPAAAPSGGGDHPLVDFSLRQQPAVAVMPLVE